VGVTLDNLEDLPKHSRSCVYWELAPHLKEQAEEFGTTELEKEAWVSSVLLEWGSCGRIVYSDKLPVGFVLYAPPTAVPRSSAFPTSPPSPDAVLLTGFYVQPEFRGGGLGRVLVQAVAKDLTRRGRVVCRSVRLPAQRRVQDGQTAPSLAPSAPGAPLGTGVEGRRRGGAGEAPGHRFGVHGEPRPTAVSPMNMKQGPGRSSRTLFHVKH
jgi:GNAT superfamily N-acetyltransferase